MFVYSKKIFLFINEIKGIIKQVLSNEVGLRVVGNRFHQLRVSYPISVVIYNHKNMLGYFDPNFFELGFHECLMHSSKEQLHNLIRHEIAHYIVYIENGSVQAHGTIFRDFCKKMGWGEEVYSATTCLDDGRLQAHSEESSLLRKVQKLMALATSSNQNEAEQAMIKSQQLLLKYNIDAKYLGPDDEEKIVVKRIMSQRKENAKMRSIARILETFFVSCIYSRGEQNIYLEILGTEINVEIAEYVASTLCAEFEKLWDQAQKFARLKGIVAKNSFFLGIARGYCDKIQALKKQYSPETTNALMVIEKQLMTSKEMVYARLKTTKSQGSCCSQSAMLGELMGRQLQINPALNKSKEVFLLT